MEKEKINKIKEIKKELAILKKQNNIYRQQMSEISQKIKDEYELERKLKLLTHQFQKNDYIVLKTYEIAQIQKLIGNYHYEVFVETTIFKSGIRTKQKIHQKEILCHIIDLILVDIKELNYKKNGFRRIN